jgi:cation transport regulator
MPYERNADLPKPVRDSLPKDAQTIYRKAFNHAWEQYGRRDERRARSSREETAHRVAWAAVKRSYAKHGDRWVKGTA